MRDYARKTVVRAKKGDDRFVTLFFALFAPLAAFVFLATATLLGTRDTLVRYVPDGAAAYVHGEDAGAERILSSFVDGPLGVHPREAAAFFLTEDDGRAHRAILLAWGPLQRPDAAELAALAERGGTALDRNAYFIGDDVLASAVRAARSEGRSLARNASVARALASVRSVASVQAYADPAAVAGPWSDLLRGLPPLVAGAAPTEALTNAVVMPASVAASYFPFGFRIPTGSGRTPRGQVSSLAKTVVSVTNPDFDVVGLLFGQTEGGQATADAAKKDLADLFRAPVQVSLFPESEKKTVSVLLRFPTLPPSRVAPSVERFASSAWPTRNAFRMPDDDQAVELRIDADRYHFTPSTRPTVPGAQYLVMEQPAIRIFLAPDGSGGSLLTTEEQLLTQWKGRGSALSPKGCPALSSAESVLMRNPGTLLAMNPELQRFIPLFKAENLNVYFFGDNTLLFCGYEG